MPNYNLMGKRGNEWNKWQTLSMDEWAELRLVEEPNGTWSVWPFDSKGGRATEPVFEGLREPDALRRALDDSTPSGE